MKLLSFTRLGKTGFGAVVKDGIIDLTGKLDPEINSIKALISLNMEDEAEEYIAGKTKDLSFKASIAAISAILFMLNGGLILRSSLTISLDP